MFLNPAMSAALDRIAERADDVRRAFTPGAIPHHDDVATPGPASDFTLDPLAASAPSDAYFVTIDERGRVAYTRDGSFAVRGGTLCAGDRRAVAGVRLPGQTPAALRVDPVDESLSRIVNARVEADGTFLYFRPAVDPRTGTRESQRVVVGRVTLARFPAGTKLSAGDDGALHPLSAAVPTVGVPGDGTFAQLAPMQRDRSRIDVDRSLIRLKEAYLAFEALQGAEAAQRHLGKAAMDLVK